MQADFDPIDHDKLAEIESEICKLSSETSSESD